tara:strand:+ start:1462 stop:1635 length:174 start_codon:yes stop_codon:yes gene_type:complete
LVLRSIFKIKINNASSNVMIEYLKKNKRILLIILVIAFIELSGYGILASLSRLLNAL